MQLDWSTLLLEVINFLVLVWILKRFLYKPVLNVIAQRKAAIDKTLADADAKQKDAHALETKYQSRLEEWEREKDGLRAGFKQELEALRASRTSDLDRDLVQEREKQRVLAQRHIAEMESQAAQTGSLRGVQFTSRLLSRVASPEVEDQLVKIALEDLTQLPDSQKEALRSACRDPQQTIKVSSAFPLAPAQRDAILAAFRTVAGQEIAASFREDPALLAGIRVQAGPWTLRANLQDELAFFSERIGDGR